MFQLNTGPDKILPEILEHILEDVISQNIHEVLAFSSGFAIKLAAMPEKEPERLDTLVKEAEELMKFRTILDLSHVDSQFREVVAQILLKICPDGFSFTDYAEDSGRYLPVPLLSKISQKTHARFLDAHQLMKSVCTLHDIAAVSLELGVEGTQNISAMEERFRRITTRLQSTKEAALVRVYTLLTRLRITLQLAFEPPGNAVVADGEGHTHAGSLKFTDDFLDLASGYGRDSSRWDRAFLYEGIREAIYAHLCLRLVVPSRTAADMFGAASHLIIERGRNPQQVLNVLEDHMGPGRHLDLDLLRQQFDDGLTRSVTFASSLRQNCRFTGEHTYPSSQEISQSLLNWSPRIRQESGPFLLYIAGKAGLGPPVQSEILTKMADLKVRALALLGVANPYQI